MTARSKSVDVAVRAQHKYIPATEAEREEMLKTVGVSSVEELFADIPAAVRLKRPLRLPGAYDHYVPSVVWHLAGRGEFLTAYTPYQAELMQGELQAGYEYQSMLCALTAMDVANASMYDGASATAEAAVMAKDLTHRDEVLISTAVHPEYRQVLHTYTVPLGIHLREVPYRNGITDLGALAQMLSPRTAGVLIQHPNFFGVLEDGAAAADLARPLVARSPEPPRGLGRGYRVRRRPAPRRPSQLRRPVPGHARDAPGVHPPHSGSAGGGHRGH